MPTDPSPGSQHPRDTRLQAQIDRLPPVDTSQVTFTLTEFALDPNPTAPTAYRVSVEARINSTGATVTWTTTVPLSVGQGKTQAEVLRWLWQQPETQLRARRIQHDYASRLQSSQALIEARGGKPVELPTGDLLGKQFDPTA
jgi:hypothetical protein